MNPRKSRVNYWVGTTGIMCALLLTLLASAFGIGAGLVAFAVRRKQFKTAPARQTGGATPEFPLAFVNRPSRWLAVKSRRLSSVQKALGLHNIKPCSWSEGLADENKLFIAPAIKGWVLVFGSGLPDPEDDVDACFRFLLGLSRKLGAVQFFSANRPLLHHAWVYVKSGRVVRAYAWAGRTLWTQGVITAAERELRLRLFDYAEPAIAFGDGDSIARNVEKVAFLAARWSLDPARIEERLLPQEQGVAGEPSLRY